MGGGLRGGVEGGADPRAACFYARRALELAVSWAYKFDPGAVKAGALIAAGIDHPRYRHSALALAPVLDSLAGDLD
jgi:hypothetical protein